MKKFSASIKAGVKQKVIDGFEQLVIRRNTHLYNGYGKTAPVCVKEGLLAMREEPIYVEGTSPTQQTFESGGFPNGFPYIKIANYDFVQPTRSLYGIPSEYLVFAVDPTVTPTVYRTALNHALHPSSYGRFNELFGAHFYITEGVLVMGSLSDDQLIASFNNKQDMEALNQGESVTNIARNFSDQVPEKIAREHMLSSTALMNHCLNSSCDEKAKVVARTLTLEQVRTQASRLEYDQKVHGKLCLFKQAVDKEDNLADDQALTSRKTNTKQ